MCAFIPNTKKIMITGGSRCLHHINSTEIFDTENESITLAGPLNCIRDSHGIGVLTINDQDRIAVFGGQDIVNNTALQSAELYDAKNDILETSDIEVKNARNKFGFLTFKQGEISRI